jgi:hypothetical protein
VVPALGRVTKGLLISLGVPQCDLIESSARLIAAPDYTSAIQQTNANADTLSGLQGGTLSANTSMIWIQWVFCYTP